VVAHQVHRGALHEHHLDARGVLDADLRQPPPEPRVVRVVDVDAVELAVASASKNPLSRSA
jgi:hypothetical protein